jgi:hypothetical protein
VESAAGGGGNGGGYDELYMVEDAMDEDAWEYVSCEIEFV